MKRASTLKGLIAAAFLVAAMAPMRVAADPVADFYTGKTITIYVGFPTGGGYDLYARLVERHFGRHIPGNPAIVVQNMPGGAGRKVAAYITNVTPQDGRSLGVFIDNLTLGVLLRGKAKFSTDKFVWIGRVTTTTTVAFVWHTAPAKSVREAVGKEITIAATGAGSTSSLIPLALNRIVGTRFKPILGYRGSAKFALAMEQGETNGVGGMSWEALKIRKADWLRDKKINFLYRLGTSRHKELPDVPAITEFARNDEDRQILGLLGAGTEIGRAFAAEPGIPPARATALRRAFSAMVRSADFLVDAKKRNLVVEPLDGEAVQKIVARAAATPKPLIAKVKMLIKRK